VKPLKIGDFQGQQVNLPGGMYPIFLLENSDCTHGSIWKMMEDMATHGSAHRCHHDGELESEFITRKHQEIFGFMMDISGYI